MLEYLVQDLSPGLQKIMLWALRHCSTPEQVIYHLSCHDERPEFADQIVARAREVIDSDNKAILYMGFACHEGSGSDQGPG